MKKRAAFILALVMLTGVLVGLMPATAAAATNYYWNIAPASSGAGYSFEITLDDGESVRADYNPAVVQVTAPSGGKVNVIGIANGSTVINIVKDSAVIKAYNVTVSSSGSSTLANIEGGSVTLKMQLTTQNKNVFPSERVTVTATVKNASEVELSSSQLRYTWEVSTPGLGVTITTSNYGATASIKLDTVPYVESGTAFTVKVTVHGKNNAGNAEQIDKTIVSTDNTGAVVTYNNQAITTGEVKAYCGEVNYTYLDRDNSGVEISSSSIGTLPKFTNLGRTYTAPVGRSVGMIRYMADASPRSVTFYPASGSSPAVLTYNIVAGVKKGTGSSAGTGSSSGYGFMTLPNGYTIIESIEAANNLAIMKPGGFQQITSAMLGGVPVTAPLMSYKITDPRIATVSNTGLITALSTGVTTLEVYCNGVQIIGKHLFVLTDGGISEPEEVEGLAIKTTSVTRTLATQKNVRFRVKAANITLNGAKVAHKNLEWSSSKTSIATVDANGYVRIKAKGTCYIYASYTDKDGEEYTARFKVTVK